MPVISGKTEYPPERRRRADVEESKKNEEKKESDDFRKELLKADDRLKEQIARGGRTEILAERKRECLPRTYVYTRDEYTTVMRARQIEYRATEFPAPVKTKRIRPGDAYSVTETYQ